MTEGKVGTPSFINPEWLEELEALEGPEEPTFVKDLMDVYFRDAGKLIDEISATSASETPDFELLKRHAHSLKGISANVGASVVTEHSQSLHTAASESSVELVRGVVTPLVESYKEVAKFFDRYLTARYSSKPTAQEGAEAVQQPSS